MIRWYAKSIVTHVDNVKSRGPAHFKRVIYFRLRSSPGIHHGLFPDLPGVILLAVTEFFATGSHVPLLLVIDVI
jgi:hypothetical protein